MDSNKLLFNKPLQLLASSFKLSLALFLNLFGAKVLLLSLSKKTKKNNFMAPFYGWGSRDFCEKFMSRWMLKF